MTRHHLAESVHALDEAAGAATRGFGDLESIANTRTTTITRLCSEAPNHINALLAALDGQLHLLRATRRSGRDVAACIQHQRLELSSQLWAVPVSTPDLGGHLHDFAVPHEPNVPADVRYEPAPLVVPASIDIDIAVQSPTLGDCFLISAIKIVALRLPDHLRQMARQEGDTVIVTVGGGTYELPATLPVVDATGERAYATSPDGSTLVPYIEKAAAAHLGSYDDLGFGNATYALYWLLGDNGRWFSEDRAQRLPDSTLDTVLTAPSPLVAVTFGADIAAAGGATQDLMRDLGLQAPHVYAAETFALDGIVLADTDHAGLRRHLTVEDLRTLNPGVSWVSNEKPRLAES